MQQDPFENFIILYSESIPPPPPSHPPYANHLAHEILGYDVGDCSLCNNFWQKRQNRFIPKHNTAWTLVSCETE